MIQRITLLVSSLFLVHCAQTPTAPATAENTSAPAAYTSAAQIPVEQFFKNPTLAAVRVSPDGGNVLALKSWKNRMNVFIIPVADPSAAKQLTSVEDRDIGDAQWKNADTIVFSKDVGGDENFHIFSANIKTGAVKDLAPFPGSRTEILDLLEESSPTDILVTNNRRDKEVFDVYRINVETGASQLVAENKNKITGWLADHEGKVRAGIATDGVKSVLYFEKYPGKPMLPIFTTDFRNELVPAAFTADNKHLIAVSNLGRNLSALVEIDPALPASKFLTKTIYAHDKYDLSGADWSYARKEINRVTVVTDRREIIFLNAEEKAEWEGLKAQLGVQGLIMGNSSLDDRKWVVRTLSDRSRGNYFVYDRDSKKAIDMGAVSPWLPADLMSEVRTVHYKTRDGLTVEGYLTLPHGTEAKNLPVIVNPHGGPWARDEWGFSPEAQFLASRGYAVLKMNFRGSTGYGRKFWEASFKQWGKKMQNDVSDGTAWLAKEKIADAKRICIYGASYGGYTTLAGAAFTPDLYACAIDYVGVANLFTFMKTIPPYWKPYLEMMHVMVGDPVKDKTLLASASPVFHADKIKAPLFIAQGANDPRVNKNESDQMVEALKKRGVDVEYMVKNNEGHGFHNEENRFDFYRAMEKFLAKHLKGAG